MEIRIVTVGKIKEKYLCDGIAEYAKRLTYTGNQLRTITIAINQL